VAKAIGWALRDYSYTAPEAVATFVDDHPELTNLAKREALKAIVRRSR
jgi:3-methyladenine DNA glycosylase AlkD